MKFQDLRKIDFTRLGVEQIVDLLVQVVIFLYIANYFSPEFLFSRTTTSGGDTASHYYTAQYLKDYLLPQWKILGWVQGNFAGFPMFQFYFPLPFVLMVFLSYPLGLQIGFKIVTALGVFLLPICTYLAFRLLGFRFPTPSLAALLTLPFLFMEANSMWGGNIPSTLAGEFTYSIGLALMILFAGSCYRGILENRWVVGNAILLAMVGFSHGYTLLFAVAFSTYYLIALPRSARNLKYLTKMHGLAFCLMGFWIIPLLAYTPFTTRYNFIWVINNWKEILPQILWPSLGIATALTLYKLIRMIRPSWRQPFDLRIGLLWYILGLSYLFYMTAFRIHVVDIRFLPFLQLSLGLLAAVSIGFIARRLRANWMVPLILAPCILLWTEHHVSFIHQWISWNYSGFEKKTLWPAFSGVNQFLAGDEADPRVVYEHSPDHNAAGTVRAFESIPLFSGRNTLEGLYMQSSISSPFVFYIQSEISAVASCPLPDYHCSTLDLERGAEHLRLFNVRDFIVRSDAVKKAVRKSPSYSFEKSIPPYDIYQVKNSQYRYVVPLRYQPILLRTENWKADFYDWFKRPGSSLVHLVHPFNRAAGDGEPFSLTRSALPKDIPLESLGDLPHVTEEISQEEIRITTDKIGHPLLIKITYHPRWQVEGADRIYLASPSFMLIYPTSSTVRLYFGDPPLVHFGQALTGVAWIMILMSWAPVTWPIRRIQARIRLISSLPVISRGRTAARRFFDWFDSNRSWVAPLGLLVALGAALFIVTVIQQSDAGMLYKRGLDLFTKQRYEDASNLFRKAIAKSPTSPAAINSNYYLAICYFKRSEWQQTINIFTAMIKSYPDSIYVPEAEYHIALCRRNLGHETEAVAGLQSIISRFPASPWALHSKTQLGLPTPDKSAPAPAPPAVDAVSSYTAAMALYDQGLLPEAEKAFHRIVEKYPDHELADDATMHYVFTLFRRQMYWQTITELRIMLRKYNQSSWIPEARYHIGVSLKRLNKSAEAADEFKWILSHAPNSRWAGFAKARLAEIGK